MATIQGRVDDEIKKQADEVLNQLGMTWSQSVNILVHAIVRKQGFPIDLNLSDDEQFMEHARELFDTHEESFKRLKDL